MENAAHQLTTLEQLGPHAKDEELRRYTETLRRRLESDDVVTEFAVYIAGDTVEATCTVRPPANSQTVLDSHCELARKTMTKMPSPFNPNLGYAIRRSAAHRPRLEAGTRTT